jgi:hypothetical protein
MKTRRMVHADGRRRSRALDGGGGEGKLTQINWSFALERNMAGMRESLRLP